MAVLNRTVVLHPVAMERSPGYTLVSLHVSELIHACTELVGFHHPANSSEATSSVRTGSVCILFLPVSISQLPLFSKSAQSFSTLCSGLWLVVTVRCDYCMSITYILIILIGWELTHDPSQTSWNQQDSFQVPLFELQGNGSSLWLEVNGQRGRPRSCW